MLQCWAGPNMVYSRYEKQRILYHRFKGLKAPTIAKILVEEERLGITRQGAHSFLKRYRETRMADGQAMGGHLYLRRCQGDCGGSNTGLF